MLSADPRVVPKAVPVPFLTYEEATELAYFGAQALHLLFSPFLFPFPFPRSFSPFLFPVPFPRSFSPSLIPVLLRQVVSSGLPPGSEGRA